MACAGTRLHGVRGDAFMACAGTTSLYWLQIIVTACIRLSLIRCPLSLHATLAVRLHPPATYVITLLINGPQRHQWDYVGPVPCPSDTLQHELTVHNPITSKFIIYIYIST